MSSNNSLQWANQNWKRIASAYLQPADITDIVSIPPDSYIRFDCEPVSALGFELKHDQTGNYFVFREKDGTQIYKYTHKFKYIYICIFAYIYIYIYICIFVYIYI